MRSLQIMIGNLYEDRLSLLTILKRWLMRHALKINASISSSCGIVCVFNSFSTYGLQNHFDVKVSIEKFHENSIIEFIIDQEAFQTSICVASKALSDSIKSFWDKLKWNFVQQPSKNFVEILVHKPYKQIFLSRQARFSLCWYLAYTVLDR